MEASARKAEIVPNSIASTVVFRLVRNGFSTLTAKGVPLFSGDAALAAAYDKSALLALNRSAGRQMAFPRECPLSLSFLSCFRRVLFRSSRRFDVSHPFVEMCGDFRFELKPFSCEWMSE